MARPPRPTPSPRASGRARIRIATVLAVILAGLGIAGGGSADVPSATRVFRLGSHLTEIRSPEHPSRRVVLYLHGASGSALRLSSGNPSTRVAMFDALLRAGYTVAASNADGRNWGDPASVAANEQLLAYLRGRGLTRVYVIAESMGGLDGLELVDDAAVTAWEGIFPVCNLRDLLMLGRFDRSIRRAWGRRLDQALAVLSPFIPGPAFRGLPMLFLSSPQDRIVPKTANTDLCARGARRAGARVRVVTTTGGHEDPVDFQPARTVAFFDAAGRR